tara:strand:- start:132 stop:458 length:327 start_codon:yes stop_codon:yes gene_type:complete
VFKKSIIISFFIFFILMFLTPIIKNNTRIIEKNVYKLTSEIAVLEKQLMEAKIDFIYLSSPAKLNEKLLQSEGRKYYSFDHSRIFLSTDDFLRHTSQQTKQTTKRENY